MPTIRPSRDDDIDAITLIYAHHVLHGTGTFEVDPPSVQDLSLIHISEPTRPY